MMLLDRILWATLLLVFQVRVQRCRYRNSLKRLLYRFEHARERGVKKIIVCGVYVLESEF